MSAEFETFMGFVNTELPKRISTESDPLSVQRGYIPVTTGIGLGVEFIEASTLALRVGLVTANDLSVSEDGVAILPSTPYGGVVYDMALVKLDDGSYLEVTGVVVEGNTIKILPEDYEQLKDSLVSVTVSYIGESI